MEGKEAVLPGSAAGDEDVLFGGTEYKEIEHKRKLAAVRKGETGVRGAATGPQYSFRTSPTSAGGKGFKGAKGHGGRGYGESYSHGGQELEPRRPRLEPRRKGQRQGSQGQRQRLPQCRSHLLSCLSMYVSGRNWTLGS